MNAFPNFEISSFRKLISIFLFAFIGIQTFAQNTDSAQVKDKFAKPIIDNFPDSIFRFITSKPIPKRAGLYSACLPGLGQLYNKQYWKIGLLYGGGAIITGFVISNYRNYTKYRKAYIGMIDNNPDTPNTYDNYTIDDVKLIRDGYRKYLEYSIIAESLAYILNILDAFISAHLKSFDMSKDISFRMAPSIDNHKQVGLQLSFCLK